MPTNNLAVDAKPINNNNKKKCLNWNQINDKIKIKIMHYKINDLDSIKLFFTYSNI